MRQIERNEFEDGGWILKKVGDYGRLRSFDCGNSDLNDFFQNDCQIQKEELLSETYALFDEATGNDSFPVALIALCNDSVKKADVLRFLQFTDPKKKYPFYPAVKIARLGVRSEFKRQNLGSHMINMTKWLFLCDNRTGCRLLTVDAYNQPGVIGFYDSNDFQFLSDSRKDKRRRNRTMFYDLKRLKINPKPPSKTPNLI